MKFNPDIHQRRSIRLKCCDYTIAGAYFVTICTCGKEHLFGDITKREMRLNELGEIVGKEWRQTGYIRKNVELDEFIVMPNHFHGIIILNDPVGATRWVALRSVALPSFATRSVNKRPAAPETENSKGRAIHRIGYESENSKGRAIHRIGYETENNKGRAIHRIGDETENHKSRAIHRIAPTTLQANSIGSIIGQFKSIVTKTINRIRKTPALPVWQRNYYERVIRNEYELQRIREYIIFNPLKWDADEYHPDNL